MDWGSRITYLASTALKERTTPFGIKDADRTSHVCIVGRPGSGRAPLLARMALQDIERNIGVVVVDASGNLAPLILERLGDEEQKRMVYLDPSDAEYPFSWNCVNEFRGSSIGKELFRQVLPSLYGVPRSSLTDAGADEILDRPDETVLSLFHWLSDEKIRAAAFPEGSTSSFVSLMESEKDQVALLNENGRYLAKDTMVRNLIGQKEGKFQFSSLADASIIVVDVSRIRIFPTRVTPIIKLFVAAARAQAAQQNVPVGLYLHDCLRYFTQEDVDKLFAERALALSLSDAIYREDDLPLREKSLARCGSIIAFQPHPADLSLVGHALYPYVTPEELSGLEQGEAAVALTIDGVRSRPFFAQMLELPERRNVSLQDIFVTARQRYTTTRTKVDESFKVKKEGVENGKKGGKNDKSDPGAFSDAFRSIFNKKQAEQKAGTPNPASGPKAPEPQGPPPGMNEPVVKTPEPEKITEVAEDVLKQFLYVGPLPA